MDARDDYEYAWSPTGARVDGLKTVRRQGQVNMIAAYRAGQLLAPFTVEGACHRTVFEIWLETGLMPVLKPGDWVLVDDATFHHGERRKALIEAVGAQVVYLPRPIPLTSTVLRKVGPG